MKVSVTDFQSLGRVVLDVRGFTVLVGPSNRGKSALIRAIEAALFNRPGDQFVRLGQRDAFVELLHAPTADGKVLLDIEWRKGKSKTRYTIGGHDEPFTKVGQGVAPPIVEAGYRDVWIGDKDRKSGEAIRPQVAGQFDRIFLLDRGGSFVADVLGTISRHAVLLTAQGRAAADERSTKSRLTVRQGDLATAVQHRDTLAAVPDLARRVAALVERQKTIDSLRATLDRVRELAAQRRRLAMFMRGRPALPPSAMIPPSLGQRAAHLRVLTEWRCRVGPVATLPLPLAAVVAEWTGYRETAARYHVERRRLLAGLGTAVLAAPVVIPPDLAARGERARGMVHWRLKLAPFRAVTLPPATPPEFIPRAEDWQRQHDGLLVHVAARRRALDTLFNAERGFRGIDGEFTQLTGELDLELQQLRICPVCERPMEASDVPHDEDTAHGGRPRASRGRG